ncbi:hypothetical protein GGI04_004381 [Coemansia thaxteri]|uniref:Uncharacterized protein n=1 Tax=Coemansia thaxteri TaxID=2663907 RepID=A0A9W8EIK8_9FUNG|nr:hypothetical protein GGI04_004381 [Coemansia thaxteri]KAJ2002854.1 hypothetical protein H4R26_003389 [Coemansia thaxteri]KAJ2483617.1 hypothetical protein EV174_002891 [Coemansia sp. RSA 2320]
MQIKASILALVCLSGYLASAFDFHSDEAAECTRTHWDEIRDVVNPKLLMMNSVLPPDGVRKIRTLLNGSDQLPKRPPPRDWLGKAADAVPEGIMNMFGKDIIEKCVNEMHERK